MKRLTSIMAAIGLILTFTGCNAQSQKKQDVKKVNLQAPKGKAIAAFAMGCFWCSGHILESVSGIDSVISGYAGGSEPNPTYESVSSETTGHAETVLIYYDPKITSYAELTRVFFAAHDPTTLNQQGPDKGTSYRSILFYRSPNEKALAQQAIRAATQSGRFLKPIVTELKPLTAFYRAESYHQDYAKKNPNDPYIRSVSNPRYELFKKTYKGKLK
jgi:peptide-methionine (S)-S-oxide reductase